MSKITGVVVASVVPERTSLIKTLCRSQLRKNPLVISSRTRAGITIKYKTPATLGTDRLCNAIAAYAKYQSAVIVVDWGTATKFDVVDKKGNYLGGAIAPGIGSTMKAFTEQTAQLRSVPFDFPISVVGNNTVSSIQSGVLYGIVELTKGMLTRMKIELGGKPAVIATGGFAPFLLEHLEEIDEHDPYLVLKGARVIVESGFKSRSQAG